MALIVVNCNDFDSYNGGNTQRSYSIISFDISVYHCFHERGYINVMLILQSCKDSLHILPGSSSDTCKII